MTTMGALVAAGRTSDVFEFGSGSVVKVPRPNVPVDWAAKEASFTAAVREQGAPAPMVRDLVQIDGRDAIVFERVDGISMWEAMLANPADAEAMGRELGQVHLQILRVGLPNALLSIVDRMRVKIVEAWQLTASERDEAFGFLASLPRGAALLHGDLHPGNVLMSTEGPVAIDWFDAAIGHPVADVVRSSVLIRPLDERGSKPHLPGGDAGVLRVLHDSYVDAMSGVLSRPGNELRQWEAVVAASRLAEDAEEDDSVLLSLWRDRR